MAQNRLVAAALEEVGFYVYLREKKMFKSWENVSQKGL